MPPQRLVRRQPLAERLSSLVNPFDLFLAFSIWLESHDWDNLQNTIKNPLGLALNVLCLISCANSNGAYRRSGADDVLRRPAGGYSGGISSGGGGAGWGSGLSYFVCVSPMSETASVGMAHGEMISCLPLYGQGYSSSNSLFYRQFWVLSWVLAAGSVFNAVYCFSRKRRYRLFESNIEIEPTTPSARRVPVDSSPTATSPLRLFGNIMESFASTPESRSRPDETRHVWEVSVWDPTPLSLRLFAIFSPVHVLIYFLALPVATSNTTFSSPGFANFPTPLATNTVGTILMMLATQLALSAQLIYTQVSFTQQAKDTALIHKEVLHEYDQKFVHPRLNVLRRDVAVQTASRESGEGASVSFFTPNPNGQGFRTAPNPNYADLTIRDRAGSMRHTPSTPTGSPFSPMPVKGSMRQPQFGPVRRSTSTSTSMNDSGSFGTDIDEDYNNGDDDATIASTTTGRAEGRYGSGTPRMPRSSNIGMHGLVNMSMENSRNISPSKMNSPLRRGYAARGSSYAGSLGTPLGSSVRRSANNGY
ncbi:unnamed protein product [Tuber aestivum]|uniref:Meiotically up-regulated gene 154 protein n=1 Tax=Tuber aestivum TaxID=59557 RepID=A0A292PP71_9PEZI|nr:unnamed protein product [Tuber aestivum]